MKEYLLDSFKLEYEPVSEETLNKLLAKYLKKKRKK